jgi:Fic family protein
MQEILQQVQSLWDELNALRPLTPDQEQRIWQKFRLDWNYHSNNIEGNSLTYGETKSLLLHNITAQGKPLKHHLEITGHNEAIDEIIDTAKQQRPLTESLLRSWHTLILHERSQVDAQTADGKPTKKWIEVGQYKSQPNHVMTVTGEVFRFAEPFEVAPKMQALIVEANEKKPSMIEGLLQAAKLHYQFVLIHPFDDGNGRMARLLMNVILMQYGLPPAIIKTEAKVEYFSALRQADGGQFEQFAAYIAAQVSASLTIMIAGARGESIEDPDDIDKKISLFLGLAKKDKGFFPAARSSEWDAFFIHTVIPKLLIRMLEKIAKLNQLYAMTQHIIKADYYNAPSQSFFTYIEREDVRSQYLNFGNHLIVNLFFEKSNLAEEKNFSYLFNLQFDTFGVACVADSVVVAKVAYNAPDHEEFILKIIRACNTTHLNWLQENTDYRLPK